MQTVELNYQKDCQILIILSIETNGVVHLLTDEEMIQLLLIKGGDPKTFLLWFSC